jgi:DNA-binding transcriptional ArsR family regulator
MNRRSDDISTSHGLMHTPDESRCEVSAIDSAAVQRVAARLPAEDKIKHSADVFAALGDPTRLGILSALAVEELCVCDIAAVTGTSQSAVSHQLRILRQLNLVAYRREGKRAVYRLADSHVLTLLEVGAEHADERIR